MTEQQQHRPQIEPHEARLQAEAFLGPGPGAEDLSRAIAYGLLAVAGELAEIRRVMAKRR